MDHETQHLSILFRGKKIILPLKATQNVLDFKVDLIEEASRMGATVDSLSPDNVKLVFKGKALSNDAHIVDELLQKPEAVRASSSTRSAPTKTTFHLVATGLSAAEVHNIQASEETYRQQTGRLVKDDLSDAGKLRQLYQAAMGRRLLKQHQTRADKREQSGDSRNGFGSIETLPGLPSSDEARRILETLANDPGILACMAKHKWHVGTLAELYPEGKVGESAVCVMGLNQNRGAKILLRLRTDNLAGFRKPLSIRKVLYHELAHNVYSDHDDNFFRLMRQIEQECRELDWTNGQGTTLSNGDDMAVEYQYTAGSYRLGGGERLSSAETPFPQAHRRTMRELAATAAELRLSAEDREIMQNCGCQDRSNLFLPKPIPPHPMSRGEEGSKAKNESNENKE
jgi:WLM domain